MTWQKAAHNAATANFPPDSPSGWTKNKMDRRLLRIKGDTLTLEGQETHLHLVRSARLFLCLKTNVFGMKGRGSTRHILETSLSTPKAPRLTVTRSIPACSPAERSKFPVSFKY